MEIDQDGTDIGWDNVVGFSGSKHRFWGCVCDGGFGCGFGFEVGVPGWVCFDDELGRINGILISFICPGS
jgi:hypothetical protein